MTAAHETLGYLRETAAAALSERGYDVIFRPAPHLLPPDLSGLAPDAIAIGREPKLVVIVTDDSGRDAARIDSAKTLLDGHKDWSLHLFVYRPASHPEPAPAAPSDIKLTLARVKRLAASDPEAALLVAWASLEALARLLMPKELARAQSSGRVVERLAHDGIVTPSEGDFLLQLAAVRNQVAHGDLKRQISAKDVTRLADIIENVLDSEAA